ncbi:MAG TPA: Rid family detoxifying hydrolase [Acidimicrobiia bacterium]|nr:Rid family detoxifying hydrolase [Acidimicrobiia bacterium]
MARHLRSVPGAPAPVGPYSIAVESNGLVFLSGQGAINPLGGGFTDSIEDQTRQTMENLRTILGEHGLDFSHVVKASIFLVDMGDFAAMNSVYATYFDSDPPARTTVAVAALPLPEMKVEIDMVAAR